MGRAGLVCIAASCLIGLRAVLCYLLWFKIVLVLWVLVFSIGLVVGRHVGLVFCGLVRLCCGLVIC